MTFALRDLRGLTTTAFGEGVTVEDGVKEHLVEGTSEDEVLAAGEDEGPEDEGGAEPEGEEPGGEESEEGGQQPEEPGGDPRDEGEPREEW